MKINDTQSDISNNNLQKNLLGAIVRHETFFAKNF